MISELKRKFFHLTALIYVLGIVFLPRIEFLIVSFSWVLLVAIGELFRMKVPLVKNFIQKMFGNLIREKEQDHFSGVFWMALGVFSTALLVSSTQIVIAALLYLILGDAVASLSGKFFKGKEIGNTGKRWSGSLACFLICLFVGLLILRPEYAWHGVILGALTAAILEMGFIPINDNFIIPFGSSIVLLLSYNLFL